MGNAVRIVVVVMALCSLVAAVPASSPAIAVTSSPTLTTVEIVQASTLNAVLTELCARTGAECEGLQQLSETVAPEKISGTWVQVVSKLLEGSRVNFVMTPPSGGSGGKLIVEGRAKELEAVPATADHKKLAVNSADNAYAQMMSASPQTPTKADDNQQPPSPDNSEATPEKMLASQTQAGATATTNSDGGSDASVRALYPEPQSVGSAGTVFPSVLPFTGQNGQPMAASQEMPTVLPFVDSHGNPMPRDPNPPTVPVNLLFTNPGLAQH